MKCFTMRCSRPQNPAAHSSEVSQETGSSYAEVSDRAAGAWAVEHRAPRDLPHTGLFVLPVGVTGISGVSAARISGGTSASGHIGSGQTKTYN